MKRKLAPVCSADQPHGGLEGRASGMLPGLIKWDLDGLQSMDGLRTDEEILAGVEPSIFPEVPWGNS
jgi:hypothetical protein